MSASDLLPTHVTLDAYLDSLRHEDRLLLLDFWAPWCIPCSLMKRNVAKVTQTLADVATVGLVNIDEEPGLVEHFGVRGTPTFVLVAHGEVLRSFTGIVSCSKIEKAVREELQAIKGGS